MKKREKGNEENKYKAIEFFESHVVDNGISIASLNFSWKEETGHLYPVSCPTLVEGHPRSSKFSTFLGFTCTMTEWVLRTSEKGREKHSLYWRWYYVNVRLSSHRGLGTQWLKSDVVQWDGDSTQWSTDYSPPFAPLFSANVLH